MSNNSLKIIKSICDHPDKKKILFLNPKAFGEYSDLILALQFLSDKMEELTTDVVENELSRFSIDLTDVPSIRESQFWYWVEQLEHESWVNETSDEIIKALEMSRKFPRKAKQKIYDILSKKVNLMDEGETDLLTYDLKYEEMEIGMPLVIKDEKYDFFSITKGLPKGCLGMLLGGSGIGKSIMMTNLAYWAYMTNYNVVYISLEMPIKQIMARLWRRVTGLSKENLYTEEGKASVEKYKKRFSKRTNHMLVKSWPPSQCGVFELGQYLERLLFKPDMVIIDYMDIMKMPGGRSEQEEQGDLGNQLKTLAMSKNVAIWTGIQLSGIETMQKKITLKDIGYSKKKGMIADIVIGLNTLPIEKDGKKQKMTFFTLAKNRDGRAGMICKMPTDWDKMRWVVENGTE